MCGIAGIIDFRRKDIEEDQINRMVDILAHRGPDGRGIYRQAGLALGHRRLAIIDLSEAATQPLNNETQDVWVVVNGMIYNFRELRKELEAKGHHFKSKSDSEVVVHLYEEYGEDCIPILRGMFALAIWDKKREILVLARDRIGQKPLVYTSLPNKFYFASEPKAIFATQEIPKEIDMTGMHHFFSYMNVPWPYTMYKNVKQLPPACILKVELESKSIKIDKYWKPDLNTKLDISIEESASKLLSTLEESVKLRLISDVPIGALLSGGIDSSSIVALMSRFLRRPVETFSVGYETSTKKDPEFGFSKIVSDEFKTNHHQISVDHNIIKVLPEMLWFYDEPYANPVALPNFELCRIMKKGVTVVFSGDGGDETFAGYPGYLKWKAVHFINRLFPFISKSKQGAFNLRSLRKASFSRRLYGNLYVPELRKEIKEINTGVILDEFYLENDSNSLLDNILFMDLILYNAHGVSLISDISGMSNGLEIRSPFLDHKLVEFVFSLPINNKVKGFSQTKYILRKAMGDILPKSILSRKKIGYGEGIPFKEWFCNEWKDTVRQFLFDGGLKKSGIFQMKYVKELFDNHMNFRQDNFNLLWSLVCFSVWHENVFIKN